MPKTEPKNELPYTLGEWKGLPQYRCKFCAFDTLNEPKILEHYASRHAPKPEPKPTPLIQSFDRWGNPLNPSPAAAETKPEVKEEAKPKEVNDGPHDSH